MEEIFFGNWYVEVSQKSSSAFSQRFRIVGSDSSDGTYMGTPGMVINVSGEGWKIIMEWNDGVGSRWQSSDIRRLITYSVSDGLVKKLGADDNIFNPNRDYDFNDLVIICKNLDPTLNPLYPMTTLFDFTFPEKLLELPPTTNDQACSESVKDDNSKVE